MCRRTLLDHSAAASIRFCSSVSDGSREITPRAPTDIAWS
jgi:hypothetical protein